MMVQKVFLFIFAFVLTADAFTSLFASKINVNGHSNCIRTNNIACTQFGKKLVKNRLLNMATTSPPTSVNKITNNISSNERKTFKRFMQVELWRNPELEELYPVLCSIEVACRDINRLMRRVSTDNLDGLHELMVKDNSSNDDDTNENTDGNLIVGKSVNIQGEDQKKLDVIANRIMKTSLW